MGSVRFVIFPPTKLFTHVVVAAALSLLTVGTVGRVTVPVKVGLLMGAKTDTGAGVLKSVIRKFDMYVVGMLVVNTGWLVVIVMLGAVTEAATGGSTGSGV